MNLIYSVVLFCCNVFLCMLNVSFSSASDILNSLSRSRRQAKTGSCTLPEYPKNGYWSIGGPGQKVGVNTLLKFTCDDGYFISSKSASSVCEEGGWNTIPQCLRPCSNLEGTKNMNVKCFRENDEVPCSEAIHGTRAVFKCANNYYEVSDKNDKRFCFDGSWDYPPPYRCSPVCGIKPVTAVPLSIDQEEVAHGEFPWVVAIYSTLEGKKNTYIGTGTILSERIILTVAHVVASNDGEAQPPSNYRIGVGKRYVGYNDNRDLYAQYSNIEKIILHPRYKGQLQGYASDIGFLITETRLVLSKWVQPACIIQGLDYSMMSVANTTGEVAGWGYLNDKLSETVQKTQVICKDHSTCLRELPSDWAHRYLADDKFCAGTYTKGGEIGCKGFSGGGLVVKKAGRYFLFGMISLSLTASSNEKCYVEQNSLYTNIATHYNWIIDILSEYSS